MTDYVTEGFHHVTMVAQDARRTLAFYRDLLGFPLVKRTVNFDLPSTYHLYFGIDNGRPGTILTFFEWPHAGRGNWGIGGVHHVAFRTPDDAEHRAWRERIAAAGLGVTPVIDRYYFRSLYFREPGGILYEIATDGPGFASDEPLAELGQRLALPPFLEPRRAEIEAGLRPLPSIAELTAAGIGARTGGQRREDEVP